MTVTRLGEDFLIEGEIEHREDNDSGTDEDDRANCG